jgi:hypothetical protein
MNNSLLTKLFLPPTIERIYRFGSKVQIEESNKTALQRIICKVIEVGFFSLFSSFLIKRVNQNLAIFSYLISFLYHILAKKKELLCSFYKFTKKVL